MRLVAAAVVTAAAMTMVIVGTWQSSVPFVGPGDLGPELDGQRVQVEGLVERLAPRHDHLILELSDGGATTATVRYAYADRRPLTLEEGRVVVAKGLYRKGVVDAHQVSVRAHEQ
jgi:cytochrome c-type biogenesis protein CcmE